MITKSGKDVSIEALTPAEYIVPAGEEKFYHVVEEIKQFNPRTGAKLSRARLQKFGRKTYERVVRDRLIKQGYTLTVLHNPVEWLKAHVAKKAEARKAAKAAEEAAIQARIDEAVTKAVAAALKGAKKSAKKEASE